MKHILEKLNEKDIEILRLLYQARYASNKQIARLFFADSPTESTSLRRANRATQKLTELKLVRHLFRRIGGVRAGSGSYVFTLSNTGGKLLKQVDDTINASRRNAYEPSSNHLKHTLAITEVYTQLRELDREFKTMELERVEFEPQCWRTYSKNGVAQFLKPDLFAHVVLDEYEDLYMIELDCGTESLTRVLNKSKQFVAYYNSGIEQNIYGVFPLVIWLVPNEKRKLAIKNKLIDELDTYWQLFEVLTLDEFKDFVYREESEED